MGPAIRQDARWVPGRLGENRAVRRAVSFVITLITIYFIDVAEAPACGMSASSLRYLCAY